METAARFREELIVSLKKGDHARVDFLRLMIASLHNAEIEKRNPLSEEESIAILRKEAKRRKEASVMFHAGGRDDLARKEQDELLMLKDYLPSEIEAGEVERVVRGVMAQGASELPVVMREAMKILKGAADGKVVQEIAKRALGIEKSSP